MSPRIRSRDRHHRVRDKSWRSLWRKSSAQHRAFILLLVSIGAALRIHHAGQPITQEEASAFVSLSCRPIGQLLSDAHVVTGHIGHAVLVKLCTGLFGVSLWTLRLPALLAGIVALPLFHLLVRSLFNRHIALVALALAAASGCLVELSGLARGFSLTWLFLMLMLHDGRTYAVTERAWPLRRMALWAALGMWCTPAMVFPALLAFIWVMLHIRRTYDSTARRRNLRVLVAVLGAGVGTVLLYAPALATHGLEQLLNDPAFPARTWDSFTSTQQEGAFRLWAWFTDTSSLLVAVVCWIGLFHAARVSGRYRDLLLAMGLACVPLTLALLHLAPPETWVFTLFIFHLSTAISLFYLLKFVQDKLVEGFDDRWRTLTACAAMLLLFAPSGLRGIHDRMTRFPEAAQAAAWFGPRLQGSDRVLVVAPWDAPVEFHFRAAGIDPVFLHHLPGPGARIHVLVGTATDHTVKLVLDHFVHPGLQADHFIKVEDWRRLEIHAAR